ncbi:hypothetical protein [Spiroplasma phoeniceum]|uniref:Integrase n=1 Tax=Spiroplasma phoeniceum P40 TaxID=1276259 RepID=A0A345DM94_9MOLU|nr:hypothetical protein [Spiroplasma phoeniceum]AXF95332.1 integrase [Spiroplasma phoeniceum P40]
MIFAKIAGGVFSLFYNLKKGIHGEELKNKAPKNLKTFFRWLKKDERWLKTKRKIKEIKKQHPRYEVEEIGLLQMDAKYFVPSKFTVDKKYYVFYDKLSTDNAIDAVKKAIIDFKNILYHRNFKYYKKIIKIIKIFIYNYKNIIK